MQLYLGGFGLELDDLKALRTWGSLTPGHPEFGHTDGVEITTGPLGQGLASSVGFAYAARYERGLFDPDAAAGTSPFDHFVYVIAGDGDLQEGITCEASSLAGHQELGNLIAIYDSNQISIEDDTNVAFTEDVAARYEAYGWHVQTVDWKKTGEYVEDVAELHAAHRGGQGRDRPSRRSSSSRRSSAGPSPGKQNTGKIHGSALGGDELAATKKVLGFDPEQTFASPTTCSRTPARCGERGAAAHAAWQESFDAWAAANPERKALFDRLEARELPADIASALPVVRSRQGGLDPRRVRHGHQRTRRRAARAVGRLRRPRRVEPHHDQGRRSRSSRPSGRPTSGRGDPYGRVLHFGIREHAMGAIVNGIVLHGPTRAFGGTFLIFSDYMRPSVRSGRADGHPVDLRLDARLRRPRRGRPDAPADRAARDAARHPELHRRASRATRTRPSVRLARAAPPPRRPGRHRADPAEHPGVRARRGRGIR